MDDLGVRVAQHTVLVVPRGPLQEEPIQVAAVLRRLPVAKRLILETQHLVAEVDLVDGVLVPPGVVLLDTGQKALRKEEARNPEAVGPVVAYPLLENGDALLEVIDVAKERLTRGVAPFEPALGDAVVLDALK